MRRRGPRRRPRSRMTATALQREVRAADGADAVGASQPGAGSPAPTTRKQLQRRRRSPAASTPSGTPTIGVRSVDVARPGGRRRSRRRRRRRVTVSTRQVRRRRPRRRPCRPAPRRRPRRGSRAWARSACPHSCRCPAGRRRSRRAPCRRSRRSCGRRSRGRACPARPGEIAGSSGAQSSAFGVPSPSRSSRSAAVSTASRDRGLRRGRPAVRAPRPAERLPRRLVAGAVDDLLGAACASSAPPAAPRRRPPTAPRAVSDELLPAGLADRAHPVAGDAEGIASRPCRRGGARARSTSARTRSARASPSASFIAAATIRGDLRSAACDGLAVAAQAPPTTAAATASCVNVNGRRRAPPAKVNGMGLLPRSWWCREGSAGGVATPLAQRWRRARDSRAVPFRRA